MAKARYTPDFRMEIPDPTPLEKPLGWRAPLSLDEMIARAVRTQISAAADAQGQETFEEANDFDIEDDPEMRSPYQIFDAPDDYPPGYLPDASERPTSPQKAEKVSAQPETPKSSPEAV